MPPVTFTGGSSPLARGTSARRSWRRTRGRLIPARAGNICLRTLWARVSAAHPRSRGEHEERQNKRIDAVGSSPLARGTFLVLRCRVRRLRLIPARAGNIHAVRSQPQRQAAHPRSRGEHLRSNSIEKFTPGSSPLARGTLDIFRCNIGGMRLSPARAGNMFSSRKLMCVVTAHPRSRGEHTC